MLMRQAVYNVSTGRNEMTLRLYSITSRQIKEAETYNTSCLLIECQSVTVDRILSIRTTDKALIYSFSKVDHCEERQKKYLYCLCFDIKNVKSVRNHSDFQSWFNQTLLSLLLNSFAYTFGPRYLDIYIAPLMYTRKWPLWQKRVFSLVWNFFSISWSQTLDKWDDLELKTISTLFKLLKNLLSLLPCV